MSRGQDLTGYPGVAVALLAKAAEDAADPNGLRAEDARLFLESDGAATLLDCLSGVLGCDFDADDLRRLLGRVDR